MKNKLLLSIAFIATSSSAMAQSAFDGFYAQVGIGYTNTSPTADNVTLAIKNGQYAGTYALKSTYKSSNELTQQITAGYMAAIDNKFLLGLGVDYDPTKGNFRDITSVGPYGTVYVWQYKVKSHFNVFLTPAYAFDKDKLIYSKIGYSQSYSEVYLEGSKNSNHIAKGYVVGLGYKQIITGGWYGFAEANYFLYPKTVQGSTGVSIRTAYTASQEVKSSGYDVVVGVGYKF